MHLIPMLRPYYDDLTNTETAGLVGLALAFVAGWAFIARAFV